MESINELNNSAISTSTGEHPLLIPEIVENVVKQLNPSFEQLKTLRLVSKTWTEATLPHWRKSGAVLTLVPDPPLFDASDYKTGIPVSKFLAEFQDPDSPFQLSKKPFAKYKVKDIPINLNKCSEPGGIHNKFWTTIGPVMESVHFYKCEFTTPGLCPGNSLKQLVVQKMPGLQHLQLTDSLTPVPENCPECRIIKGAPVPVEIEQALHSKLRTLTVYNSTAGDCGFKEMLKVTPGLEAIRGAIRGVNLLCKSSRSLYTFVESIFGLRLDWNSDYLPRPLSNLKHLDLMDSSGGFGMDLSGWGWRDLFPSEGAPAGIQIPLETLGIHLKVYENDAISQCYAEEFKEFLKSFSSTLKRLKAFRVPVGRKPYINFLSNCSMSLLTEMNLWGTITPNFEFLRETPNLKKLRIDLGCFDKRDMLVDQIKYWNKYIKSKNWLSRRIYEKYQHDMALNVREDWRDGILCTGLEYLEIDFEFPEESLRLMGQWMPNLTTLKTILNKDTVPVVCEIWRDLTELVCLHGSKIGNGCFVRGDDEAAGFSGGAGPKLKICDLDDLKRFQLNAYCGEAELTDEVVSDGFLKMASLKCVEICVNPQMSEEAEEKLRKKIQFCKVVRDGQCAGAGVDPSGLEAGERSGCDRCNFRRINKIHGFVLGYFSGSSDSDDSDD